jgi:hypothetical protein
MSWYDKFKTGTKDYLTKGKSYASSFWYDDYDTSYDVLETYGGFKKQDLDLYKKTNNLYKLASVRRAISNFVQIVTQKNIPVTFATKSDSKTDGKKVILSADVDDKFDVSVGLALHEGSHIILSDFDLLSNMNDMFSKYTGLQYQVAMDTQREIEDGITTRKWPIDKVHAQIKIYTAQYPKYENLFNEMYLSTGKIGSKGSMNEEMFGIISSLTNWVEDRRIDMHIFKTAPGYRDYYTQMYDNYFNDKIVTKGIESDEYTDETFESYMFRIINLHNEKTDLSKLKGLRAIYRLVNLKDISRLTSTKDSFQLAIDILAEILKTVPYENAEMMKGKGQGKGQSGKDGDGDGELEITDINEDGDNDDNGDMGGMNGQMSGQATASLGNTDDGDNQQGNTKVKLSDTAKKQLDKKIQKQKDFINGDIKKKNVQKNELEKLKDIQESDTELVRVGNAMERNGNVMKGVDCIVVKRLTENMLKSDDFPFSHNDWQTSEPKVWAADEVRRGTTLGTLLGKKLQVRSESRETIFSRLKKGKIDGRMVASLGYDNENVFYTNEVDQFKKANLHISIDYSGSMSGDKLRKCIVSTVAIVKACEMARNINVQVSVRSTDRGGQCLPYVAIIHDSRRDSFKQFARYMSILQANNTTPEGLCFEAILKQLVPSTNESQSYFLNFSDGQPSYSISRGSDEIQYSGEPAALHTKKQVKKIRDSGIDVLSYFITDYGSNFEHSSDWRAFKTMYGNDAKYVNVENMFEVAKSMNELFLSKNKK